MSLRIPDHDETPPMGQPRSAGYVPDTPASDTVRVITLSNASVTTDIDEINNMERDGQFSDEYYAMGNYVNYGGQCPSGRNFKMKVPEQMSKDDAEWLIKLISLSTKK